MLSVCLSSFASGAELAAPVITSAATIEVEFGKPFEYEITATNEPLGYSIKDMPYWIERDENRLKGQAIKGGLWKLEIYAISEMGVSEPFSLTLSVK